MATETFGRALALVLDHEGGYVDHPADPGGATNLGITIGTLSDWIGRPATKAEVRALKPSTVAPIYRANYWSTIRADDLPIGVDYCVFDAAVNSGPSITVAPSACDVRFAPSPDARDARRTRRLQRQARSGVAGGVWPRGGFPGQTSVPTLQPGFVSTFLG